MTRRSRALIGLLLAFAVLLLAGGCGEADPKGTKDLADRIRVSGDFAAKPTITISAPLKVDESRSWSEITGKGDEVGSEATAIVQLTLANGRTGKTAVSTLDAGQQPLDVDLADQVFPSLATALVGKRAGTRMVVASTPADAYGDAGAPQIGLKGTDPVVMVADILATDPTKSLTGTTGETIPAPASAPTILGATTSPTGVDVTGLRKPKKLQVIPLQAGTGAPIDGPHRVTLNYLGQVWGQKTPFNNSFAQEPATFTIGLNKVIQAWDQGLAGQKEGARVMLVCPPGTAYGSSAQGPIPANATLVFVVDVLGVG